MAGAAVDSSIFKAYDVRGIYPDQIDEDLAERIGRAFAQVVSRLEGVETQKLRLALCRDVRLSSPALAKRYAAGMAATGASVLDLGTTPTEVLYYAVGARGLDGGLACTASHNPPEWTGAKLVRRGALALSGDSGIAELRALVERPPAEMGIADGSPASQPSGRVERVDLLDEYRARVRSFIDPAAVRAMKLVVDGGNGVAKIGVGPLLAELPLTLVPIAWEPDGRFPEHEPNPLLPENRELVIRRVLAERADLGIAWDGDADRCFFIDDTGRFVDGDFLTALLAEAILEKEPGATILYDVRASRAVRDTVERAGGRALVNRVGHAFFKARMRETGAVFGGEVSGHYYFRDFYCCDSGSIPALLVLELVSKRGKPLSELLEPLRSRYFISGEINSRVADPQAKMQEIAERYADAEISWLDGISVDYPDWHFNVRPSNTEPLLRLNLESLVSPEHMAAKRDEVLALIRS
ncbi:phosphomannomutase/phosphoglucomutase [Thermoleophilum album]|uniref:Phosphomannomutase n=1 Tax=Thermoleophilum album TaxID=29539 RepID=A0A1H6FWS9_THEAL|nr:phosphomannomutase/phosphoglucomutase [Thermoleophilum album]SEH14264.1 phosphomannomutase [Thermoleophilum album]